MTIEKEKLAEENEKNILKIIEEMERTLKGIDKIFSFFFWCFLGFCWLIFLFGIVFLFS